MTDFAPPTASVENAIRRLRRALVAAAFAVAAPAALAAPCAGFIDVDSASPFCPSVEWIKNRGITTGCAVASSYCPNNVVDRLAMAAFLRRLGDALTPVDLTPVTVAAAPIVLPATQPICVTPDYNVANFPRRAYVNAQAILSAPTANIDLELSAVYSVDAGASWTELSAFQYATLYTGATPANRSTLSPYGWADLNVGQNVRFGIRVTRFGGSGNVTAACTTRVQIASRTGTSSPFDSPQAAAAPRRQAD